jgi:hypothetical protein
MPAQKYLFLIWVIYVPYTYRFENSIAINHRRMQLGSPEIKSYKSVPTFHIRTCKNMKRPMRHSTRCYIEINDTYWKLTHVNRLWMKNNANVRLIYLSNNNTISPLTRLVTIYKEYRLWAIVMQNLTWQILKTIRLSSDFITVTIITIYKTFHLCHKCHKGFCYRTSDDTIGAVW